MPPLDFKLKQPGATLMVALSAAFPVSSMAAGAGRVDFAMGDVRALTSDGRARALSKGAEVMSGETVDTGNGRAQLRFTDGAQVSLQPQTQFRIDEYRFSGKPDGEEKGFFSLLKGGLRTITGLVGRSNRDAYKVTTTVATIGIRGTEYSVAYGNSITVSTGEGSVEVCNAAGCLILNSGETGYVANTQSQPVLTGQKADLPPPPAQESPRFTVSENTDSSGSVSILGGTMASGPGYTLIGMHDGGEGLAAVGTATFAGNSLSHIGIDASHYATPTGASIGAGDGLIGWGVWATADYDSGSGATPISNAHYVVGIPTPSVDINSLSGTIPYSLVGATAPSSTGTAVGTVTSGSMTASFAGGYATLSFGLSLSSGMTISGTGMNPPGSPNFGGTVSCGGTGCCTGSGTFAGFFVGSNAARAGFAYEVSTFDTPGTVWGAVAFKR